MVLLWLLEHVLLLEAPAALVLAAMDCLCLSASGSDAVSSFWGAVVQALPAARVLAATDCLCLSASGSGAVSSFWGAVVQALPTARVLAAMEGCTV